MKNMILILAIISTSSVATAQSWRDSIQNGRSLYEQGKFDEAYESLVEAQKIAPEDIDLTKDIGNAAYRKGDYEMAEKAFRSVAAIEKDAKEASKQWHNVGNSQLKRKDYQSAIESYKEALRKDPSNENARYNLSEAKRRLKKQQDQQQNQNQENDKQDNHDQQNGDNGQNQQNQGQESNNNNQGQQGQKQDQDQTQSQDPSEQQQKNNQTSKGQLSKEKLSNRKTERMLDNLLKKEMQTKRRAVGTKSSSSEKVKSGKKW